MIKNMFAGLVCALALYGCINDAELSVREKEPELSAVYHVNRAAIDGHMYLVFNLSNFSDKVGAVVHDENCKNRKHMCDGTGTRVVVNPIPTEALSGSQNDEGDDVAAEN